MKKTYTFTIDEKSYVFESESDEKPDSPSHDYEAYEKSLEAILDQVQRDFWTQYVEINRHQIIVGKNYLWISAALIGALSGVYIEFSEVVQLNSVSGVSFTLAFFLAVLGFGVSLYAMPAKGGYQMPYNSNWYDLTKSAHERLKNKEKQAYVAFLSDLITRTDNANNINLKTNGKRAELFRKVYWILVFAFGLSLISGIFYAANTQSNILAHTIQSNSLPTPENIMSNDNNDSKGNDAEKLDVPPPKPPETKGSSKRFVDHVEREKEGGLNILNENKNN